MFSICNDGESKTQGTTWVAIGQLAVASGCVPNASTHSAAEHHPAQSQRPSQMRGVYLRLSFAHNGDSKRELQSHSLSAVRA